MGGVLRPKAQIDQVHPLCHAPIDPLDQGLDPGCQRVMKNLDREDLSLRCLFANHGGDGRAVADAVHVIGLLAASAPGVARGDGNSAGHTVHVGMRGVYAAIDDTHLNDDSYPNGAAHRAAVRANNFAKLPCRACNSSGVPDSAMAAPSSTSTRSAWLASSRRCVIRMVVRPRMTDS